MSLSFCTGLLTHSRYFLKQKHHFKIHYTVATFFFKTGLHHSLCGLCCQDYFGVCTEAAIKDNVVVVYELLEEMLDNGFPLATESNILKELIKPPTILRTMVNTITGEVWIYTVVVFYIILLGK